MALFYQALILDRVRGSLKFPGQGLGARVLFGYGQAFGLVPTPRLLWDGELAQIDFSRSGRWPRVLFVHSYRRGGLRRDGELFPKRF